MTYAIKEMTVSGSRQKILVQKSIPVFYPNLYVTCTLRKRSPNTQQAFLNHLKLLLEFFRLEQIDIESRLLKRPKPNYLDDHEISRFVQHAHWRKSVLEKKSLGVSVLPTAHEQVGGAQAEARCEVARDYLTFLYENLADLGSREEAVGWLRRRMNRKIKGARPAWRLSQLDEIKGLTSKQRDLLYEKLHPEYPDNPFKRDCHRYRNYIIVLLGLELGLRRSEMLLVKLQDINYANRTIDIVRPDDNIDRRSPAPRLKTHERRLPVSDLLMSVIESYKVSYRSSENSRKHPFLLVAHDRNNGHALGLKAIDPVFEALKRSFHEMDEITAHTLRHDSVYTLLASMHEDLKGLPIEDRIQRVQRTLTYAFGWSYDSEMPGLYGAKFWREQASEFFDKRSQYFVTRVARLNSEWSEKSEGAI